MDADDTAPTVRRTAKLRRRPWRYGVLITTLVSLGLGLAGGAATPASAAPKPAKTAASMEAKTLKYSECMRSHGISDFPDPTTVNGHLGLSIHAGGGTSDLRPTSPKFIAANRACQKDLPNGGKLTPAQVAASDAKALKYTTCMRSHGEPDFPDPNGQGLIQITDPTGILAPTSSQFEAAQESCQHLDNGFDEQITSAAHAPGSGSSNPGSGSGS